MTDSTSEQPNIVWLTLDSVRQDHTSLGGYRRDTTPNMSRIAREGGKGFSQCFSHGMYTLSSSSSILSGTYPSHHGVGIDGERLPDSIETIAERFKRCGYTTACLSRNSYLSSATGLDRGFDTFAWLSASTLLKEAGPKLAIKYLLNLRKHSAGFTTDAAKHATPYVVNEMATEWLDNDLKHNEPFFFYLHYNEPHRPYHPPLPYLSKYTDELSMSPTEAVEFTMDVHENFYEYLAKGLPFSNEQWAAMKAMYDAEIAYTDTFIGKLYDHVQSLDLCPTVFVVTADHGELFGEQEVMGHQYLLHDALINVPLVVNGLELIEIGENDIIQHVDVIQTLLQRAGGNTDDLQGVNLNEEKREYAIAQRHDPEYEHVLQFNRDFDCERYHRGPLSALRTDRHKLLKSDTRRELFRLPDEETNVIKNQTTVADRLEAMLDEWLNTDGQPVGDQPTAEFNDDMRQQLQDLGYMD